MTVLFWDCIPIERRVEAYKILADRHMAETGELLDRPPGMFSPDTRQEVVIDAPDYMEEECQLEIAREMSRPPHPGPKRSE